MSRLWIAMLALGLLVGCSDWKKTEEKKADEKKTTTQVETPANVTTVSFTVPTMSCPEGCAPVVESTLAAQPGAVKVVSVDVETKIATVEVNGDFDANAAIEALAKANFAGSSVKN